MTEICRVDFNRTGLYFEEVGDLYFSIINSKGICYYLSALCEVLKMSEIPIVRRAYVKYRETQRDNSAFIQNTQPEQAVRQNSYGGV